MRLIWILLLCLGSAYSKSKRQADGHFWWRRSPGVEVAARLGEEEDMMTNEVEPAGDDCECVPYYLCANNTIITTGEGLIDIRLRTCESYLDVCCQRPLDEPVEMKPQLRRGCGDRHLNGVGLRIMGDENSETQFAEFPWMVAILRFEDIGEGKQMNVYQCGGALIHPQVVLTAAHCVQGTPINLLKIRAGEWDTQTKNEPFPHQDRGVQSTVLHEKYNPGNLRYDVALLVLDQPIELGNNIDVICLPPKDLMFDGSRCFATGWGKNVFGKEGNYQVILKKVDLPVVEHMTCQNSLRKTRLGRYFKLHKSFICAGGEPGKDTCQGDGGSPLVCPLASDPSRYLQAGIVAWGIGCGEQGTPGVYANIAFLRDWIDENMLRSGFETSSYTDY